MIAFRKRESPIDRRIVEEKYRNEQRGQDGFRPGNFNRERNAAGFERNDRARQSPRGPPPPRVLDGRMEKRQPEPDFRRDRREDANQGEWRGRGQGQGQGPGNLKLIFFLVKIHSFCVTNR